MVSSGEKVAHFFRGYAVNQFITIGTHLVLEGFGIVWIFRETQHGVFLCQIIKEKQLQYKQLVSGFFWAKWCPFPFSHVSTHRCASSCFFQI